MSGFVVGSIVRVAAIPSSPRMIVVQINTYKELPGAFAFCQWFDKGDRLQSGQFDAGILCLADEPGRKKIVGL